MNIVGGVDTNAAISAAGVHLIPTDTDTGHVINVGARQFGDWSKQIVQPPDYS